MSSDNIPADPHAHDLCVCGHERQLHGRNPDGTLGLCIRDEWCLCPGYHPNADFAMTRCPQCCDECSEDDPCGYCDNTGRVTVTQADDYRPPRPEELL